MASPELQLTAPGVITCSRLPALPVRIGVIAVGSGSSRFIRGKQWINVISTNSLGLLKKRRNWGIEVTLAADGDNPGDGGVAVEDVVEDEEGQPSPPEEQEDRENIRDILRVVELLRTKRDMTFNEVRLTIMIEDPRDVERRRLLNIEDDRGCSREELAAALVEVYEGRVPQDRLTLRELAKEMLNWPSLEDDIYPKGRTSPVESPYAKVTDTGVDPRIAASRAKVDWDSAAEIQPGESRKDLSEVLPPAVGFSFLYLISAIPVIIGVTVVVILFLNSLQ